MNRRRSHRSRRRAIKIMLRLAMVLVASFAARPTFAADPIAVFESVNLVPMDSERIVPARMVLVKNGHIAAIGTAGKIAVPAEALRIDGRGRFLMPGLADMHVHLPFPDTGEAEIDRVLQLFVVHGVTLVRSMFGHPAHLQLRQEVAQGKRLGPHMLVASPPLNGTSAPDVATARRLVREYHQVGYDLLKVHEGLSLDTFDAIAAMAHEVGIPFAGHIPDPVTLAHTLASGQATIEHLDGFVEALAPTTKPGLWYGFGFDLLDHADESRLPALAAETARAGVRVTPTLLVIGRQLAGDPEELARRPEMHFVEKRILDQWIVATRTLRQRLGVTPERADRFLRLRQRIVVALARAGVPLLLGSDAPQTFIVPGASTVDEILELIHTGLSAYEALAAATRTAAREFHSDASGTIEPGARADLILLDANPFTAPETLRRPAGVMVGGHWLPRKEIERRRTALMRWR